MPYNGSAAAATGTRRAFGHDEDADSDSASSSRGPYSASHSRSRSNHSGKRRNDTDGGEEEEEHVVSFSSRDGAEYARKRPKADNAPKVIALRGGSDWMTERKRRLNLGRHAAELGGLVTMRRQDAPSGATSANRTRIGDGSALKPGLVSMKRTGEGSTPSAGRTQEEEEAEIAALQAAVRNDATPPASRAGDSPAPSADADDDARARAALLAGNSGGSHSQGRDTERIIQLDETALTQADAANRPDAPTMEEYAALPISEFGAAMLRGMGWREGQGAGKNRQGPTTSEEVKKRPALLGLGAKERKDATSTGSSSRGKDATRPPRPETRYMPISKRSGGSEPRERMEDLSLRERRDGHTSQHISRDAHSRDGGSASREDDRRHRGRKEEDARDRHSRYRDDERHRSAFRDERRRGVSDLDRRR